MWVICLKVLRGAEPTTVVGHLLGSYPSLEIAMIIVTAEKTKITINRDP